VGSGEGVDTTSTKQPSSGKGASNPAADPEQLAAGDGPPSAPDKPLSPFLASSKAAIEAVGSWTISGVEHIGQFSLMVFETLLMALRPPYRIGILFQSMEDVGVGALFIVLLTGLFTGMVMSLQGVLAFAIFNAEALVGGSTAVALIRELGPVLTGLMVSGRSGSSMATTLGTMRVSEQIDAMEVMAVNSLQYLVAPRIVATVMMMPLLTVLFDFVGMAGAYFVAVKVMGVDGGIFLDKIKGFVEPMDIIKGAIKGGVFGMSISTLSCYRGYFAAGGAKGVGEATTSAVVMSSISILVLNYFLDLVLW